MLSSFNPDPLTSPIFHCKVIDKWIDIRSSPQRGMKRAPTLKACGGSRCPGPSHPEGAGMEAEANLGKWMSCRLMMCFLGQSVCENVEIINGHVEYVMPCQKYVSFCEWSNYFGSARWDDNGGWMIRTSSRNRCPAQSLMRTLSRSRPCRRFLGTWSRNGYPLGIWYCLSRHPYYI